MRGYIWTAFLNPINRTPISSTFFLTTPFSPFIHPKPLFYLSHSPLSLILMLLLISGDIHPNPGPIDPCSVCSRRVTWGSRWVQCTNCSLWVHLSALVFLPLTFVKFPRDTLDLPSVSIFLSTPLLPLTSQPYTLIHKHSKSPILTHKHPQNNIFKNEPSLQNKHE